MPTFEIESSLPFSFIAGCDEAGRGPLCGPVVAAAVIFLPAPLAGRDRVAYEQSELATLGWGKKSDDPTQDSLGLAQALVKPNLSRPASGAGFPININDSKKMTHAGREAAYEFLTNNPDIIWAVAQCSPSEIDEFNILAASMIAMERAIAKLNIRPEFALIDGNRLPNMICPPTGSPVALRAPGLADSPQGGSNPSSATTPPLGVFCHSGEGRNAEPSRRSEAKADGDAVGGQIPGRAIVKGDSKSLSIAAASIIAKVTRDRIMCELHKQFPQYGWDKNAGYPTAAHLQAIGKYGINEHYRKTFAPVARIATRNQEPGTRSPA